MGDYEDTVQSYHNVQSVYSAEGDKYKGVKRYYDKWPKTYNEDMKNLNYKAPQLSAEYIVNELKLHSNCSIFDVGAGTGLLGTCLEQLGFNGNLTALDYSNEMLSRLPTHLYGKKIQHEITPDTPMPAGDGIYDVVAGVGLFCPGHAKPESVKQLIKCAKVNGYLVFTTRARYDDTPQYLPRVRELFEENEKIGAWKKIEEKVFNHYSSDEKSFINVEGILFIFQKL